MKLLCDEMLRGLGRWLRAAGYDTAIAEGGATDAALLARCAAEGRTLITRDRHLAARAHRRVPVIRLAGTLSRRKCGYCVRRSASIGNMPRSAVA